jgi:uncharacterized surface protein with fasciclin (FAS1) repeats
MTSVWLSVLAVVVVAAFIAWWWVSNQSAAQTQLPQVSASTSTSEVAVHNAPVQTTDRSGSSVVAIAESISGASTFASWLQATGVASQLTGKGPYTIFVPTDGAISQLPRGTYANLSAAEKKRFVEYHVVSGRAVDADAEFAGTVDALSGDPLNFSYSSTNIPMVDSGIIIAEYKASNGIVYLINNGLVPPQKSQY